MKSSVTMVYDPICRPGVPRVQKNINQIRLTDINTRIQIPAYHGN
jgi:hypothetical protein